MKKQKDEVMRNFTLALYESTFTKLVQFKESKGWTHNQTQRELIKFYEQHEKKDKE